MRAVVVREPISNATIAGDYPWCIAGGFAACPNMARDCDVWVYNVNQDSMSGVGLRVRQDVLNRLRDLGIDFVEEENTPNQPHDFYDLGSGILCWKVASLKDGRHIILTTAETILDLLDNFDVSTHQVALSSDGELVRGRQFTPLTVAPRQLRQGTMTDARMQKIERRYAHFRPQGVGRRTKEATTAI